MKMSFLEIASTKDPSSTTLDLGLLFYFINN